MNREFTRKKFFIDNQIRFQVYGVKITINADRRSHLEIVFPLLRKVFFTQLSEIDSNEVNFCFHIRKVPGKGYQLLLDGEVFMESPNRKSFFDTVENRIRVTVAEFAESRVFLHAGVVAWRGKAIIIPGRSYAGKSTLVAELVRRGAVYYSDEYAVLDADGNVEPFPKWLSLRGIIDHYTQLDRPVEKLGGLAGRKTISASMILLMQYDENVEEDLAWQPEELSAGFGIMEILPHTFPIRNKPKFVLEVLNKLVSRAIIVKTIRGDAKQFAVKLLKYLDSHTDLTIKN